MATKFLDLDGLKYVITKIKALLANKQDTLTFDTTPTASSTNPATSGGIKTALDSKLSLSGGTMTGALVGTSFQTGTTAANYFQCQKFRGEGNADTYYHAIDFGYAGHDQVDFYEYGGVWNFWKNTSSTKGGTLVGSIKSTGWNGNVVGNVTGTADTAKACTGNSATATKLATARTITLTGNVTGSASFDGSGNVSITTTAGQATKATQDASGNVITTTYETKTEATTSHNTLQTNINKKQDKLTFDSTPTSGSTNPVTSGGVYDAINNGITLSIEASAGSSTWIEVPTEDFYVGGTEPTADNTIWLEVSE